MRLGFAGFQWAASGPAVILVESSALAPDGCMQLHLRNEEFSIYPLQHDLLCVAYTWQGKRY